MPEMRLYDSQRHCDVVFLSRLAAVKVAKAQELQDDTRIMVPS